MNERSPENQAKCLTYVINVLSKVDRQLKKSRGEKKLREVYFS